jgi:AcrR family transcriptional regulator
MASNTRIMVEMNTESSLSRLPIVMSEILPAQILCESASPPIQGRQVAFPRRRTTIHGNGMTTTKITKHELKTRETRELLLRAAETIFVREGYKGAELGEIAALAGRTKGAIYAQFKSKEDIFLALIEENMARHRAQIAALLEGSTSVQANLAVMRDFALKLTEDDSFALLMLEFKLFCIRNPKSQKRLQKIFAGVLSKDQEQRFSMLLGPAGKGKNDVSRVIAVQALQPTISALILETKLEPAILCKSSLKTVTGRIFDALFEVRKR